MSTSFCNQKPAGRQSDAGTLWLFAVMAAFILAIAAFVGIVL